MISRPNFILGLVRAIKTLEILGLVFSLGWLFWFFRLSYCGDFTCLSQRPDSEALLNALKFFFPFFGLTNSLRIGLSYLRDDEDPEPETFFYLSLGGLFFNYLAFGLFFREFDLFSSRESGQSGLNLFLLQICILALGFFMLLNERRAWELASNFVHLRISLTFIHLIILLINPSIGLFTAFFLIPVMVFWSDRKELKS